MAGRRARVASSIVTGGIAGAAAMLGLLQMIHAQTAPPLATQVAPSGPQPLLNDASLPPVAARPDAAVPTIDIRGRRDLLDIFSPRPDIPQRDPDGLYQFGAKAAVVELARVDGSSHLVYFAAIRNAATLKVGADFEYQDYVLHFENAANELIRISDGRAETPNRLFLKVICRIVGIRK